MSQLHTSSSRASRRTIPFLLLALMMALQFSVATPNAHAAPKPKPAKTNKIDLTPTVTSLVFAGGNQFLANGYVEARINGTTHVATFTNVPVNLGLAQDQSGTGACPILDLELGPIELNLLGLIVETSPICLKITAYEGGGLLGELLCAVANLLEGGLTLDQILAGQALMDPTGLIVLQPGLTTTQVASLTSGLQNLLNRALEELLRAVLRSILPGGSCDILHLELGPLDLNLLGLRVELDNCANGPVVVDITAQTGALLGDILCGLLGGGGIVPGLTLGQIIDLILGALPA